jgi:hypothetical protein
MTISQVSSSKIAKELVLNKSVYFRFLFIYLRSSCWLDLFFFLLVFNFLPTFFCVQALLFPFPNPFSYSVAVLMLTDSIFNMWMCFICSEFSSMPWPSTWITVAFSLVTYSTVQSQYLKFYEFVAFHILTSFLNYILILTDHTDGPSLRFLPL